MRNLKKFLALVLAMMMAFSLMVTVNAASDFAVDANPAYNEAVQVLNQLGIFVGDAGGFRPKSDITRAEVATILCRATTGMVDAKDYEIYRDYPAFSDVTSDKWYAPYVNFASDKGLIYGYNGEFRPNDNVTGYEMLTMLLRAIGREALGEFTGTGWYFRAASVAQQLGITRNIKDGTLGQDASRETVAEMLFRTIAKTYLMEYSEVTKGYVPRGTYSNIAGGTVTQTTLGYENFGLYGAGEASYGDIITTPAAQPDEENDITLQAYGEPVHIWTAKKVDLNGDGATTTADKFIVTFTPDATYVDGVTRGKLFADGYETFDNIYEDGAEASSTHVDPSGKNDTNPVAGRGTIVDVYVVEGDNYIVIKNIYTDQVQSSYEEGSSTNSKKFALANDTDGNGPGTSFTDSVLKANLVSGLKKDDVVIYTKYSSDGGSSTDTVDVASVHKPVSRTVTVTDSKNTTDADTAYFKVGSTTYEYNTQYDQNAQLTETLVDRGIYPSSTAKNQLTVYLDDNNYVVHTEEPTAAGDTVQYFLVTNAGESPTALPGYEDAGFVRTFTAYGMDGNKTTIKGAINSTAGGNYLYYYASKDAANAYQHTIDIYKGTYKDGYWALENAAEATGGDLGSTAHSYAANPFIDEGIALSGEKYAGDPELVSTTDLVTDETVFLFATYDIDKELQTSTYKKVVGFKNIGSFDAAFTSPDVDANKYFAHYVTFQQLDSTDSRANQVAFVYITGAELDDAADYSKIDIVDELLYLVDDRPEKNHDEYDTYDVVKGGANTTQRAVKGLDASGGDLDNTGDGAYDTFYTYKTNGKGWLTEATAADEYNVGAVSYVAPGILKIDSLPGGATEASKIVRGNSNDYLVLDENCKIYAIDASGNVSLVDAANYKNIATAPASGKVAAVQCVVAQANAEGYVTVLYLANNDIPT